LGENLLDSCPATIGPFAISSLITPIPKELESRWRAFGYEELMARDKANLDIFWLRDESLEDSDNLPDPDVLAREIMEELKAALVQFAGIVEELEGEGEEG
jgi:type I restriction enzyme M protein